MTVPSGLRGGPIHLDYNATTPGANLVGCAPGEIVFTGGGTDSDTLAIRGAALVHRHRSDHVITQTTEHPAVLATIDALRWLYGFRVTLLPVDQHGLVYPAISRPRSATTPFATHPPCDAYATSCTCDSPNGCPAASSSTNTPPAGCPTP